MPREEDIQEDPQDRPRRSSRRAEREDFTDEPPEDRPRRSSRRAAREDFADEPEDRPRRPSRRRREEDEDEYEDRDYDIRRNKNAVETIIPFHNPKALWSYYLGVFSLIPCLGLILGPAALILGMMGMNYRKKNPEVGGLGHCITGLILGSLTVLGHVVVLIIMIAAVALKN